MTVKSTTSGQKFSPAGIARTLLALAIFTLAVTGASKSSWACICTDCSTWQQQVQQEMDNHEQWMINEWWGQYVKPALRKLTDEARNAMVVQTVMIGAFIDGETAMNAQRTLQELNANTMKNYHVSDSICKFGTLSRSLASSQGRAKANQVVLSERSQNRQLGHKNMASAEGGQRDRIARYNQFIKNYCDPADYGTAMGKICTTPPVDKQRNLDINYTRLIDTKRTLDADFAKTSASTTPTADEAAVIALANNLYAHEVLDRMQVEGLRQTDAADNRSTYLDQRSIVAKRSVAENSFNAIVGMKTKGSTASLTYMKNVLSKLGLSSTDVTKYLGASPSYDAQMEVLTKKLYQDPGFYANLMETPANVERQYAALQSFGLMQRRDIFETMLRSEMLMSMLLEMEISRYQDDVQNRQNK